MYLKKIQQNSYYSNNGIIKFNNNFYVKINNKIQLINIEELISNTNAHIECIKYEIFENIDNLEISDNLELHFTILFLKKKNTNIKKNIEKILNINYKNYDLIIIDSYPDDNSNEILDLFTNHTNLYYFENTQKCSQIENLFLGSVTAKNNSIIVPIYEEIEYLSENFLNILNKTYLLERCMLTFDNNFNFNRDNFIYYLQNNDKICNNTIITFTKDLLLNILNFNMLFDDIFFNISIILISIYLKEIANDRIFKTNNDLLNLTLNPLNITTECINLTNTFFKENKELNIFSYNENNFYYNIYYKKYYDNNKTELIVTELLKFLNIDNIVDYKHLLYLPNLFSNFNFEDKYQFVNPLHSNSINVDLDLKKNIINYLDFIKNKTKIKLISNNNYLLDYNNLDYDNILYNFLVQEFLKNIINFKFINYEYHIHKKNAKLNIIIPIRGRKDNLIALINNIKENSKDFDIMITIVEYNNIEHKEFCFNNLLNYISIDCKIYDFNKSLLANFSYLLYKKLDINYDFILFHDVDLLVKKNFFHNIFNLDYNNCFIQPFYKKRWLWADNLISDNIRSNKLDINTINENTNGITVYESYATCGGTVFMKKEMFENIGGLDYYYFDCYGGEDFMLFHKLLILYKLDYPTLDSSNLIHLWHELNTSSLKTLKCMKYYLFTILSFENKKKLIELFKKHLLEDCII